MRLSSGVPISGSICFKNPVSKGSSRQVEFLEELIKEHYSFNLMGVKESRHIAGLKGRGEILYCLPYLNAFGFKEVHEVITTVSSRNAWVSRCMALC